MAKRFSRSGSPASQHPAILILGVVLVAIAVSAFARTMPAPKPDDKFALALNLAEKGRLGDLREFALHTDRPALQALANARLAASRLDRPGVRQSLREFFDSKGLTAGMRAQAFIVEMDSAFSEQEYASAERAASAWLALPRDVDRIHPRDGVAQTAAIARILKGAPALATVSSNPMATQTQRDVAGLVLAPVKMNDAPVNAVLDTGANISAISKSFANKVRLRLLAGEGGVTSATSRAVGVRVGVIDRFEIGGVVLNNVPFLVLDDDQLKLPVAGGYQINAIVGFPVFKELGRFSFDPAGTFSIEQPLRIGAEESSSRNLFAAGNDLFVTVSINGHEVPLHLDTGAAQTGLTQRFASVYPHAASSSSSGTIRIAGAGGTAARRVMSLDKPRIAVDGREIQLENIDIDVTDKMSPDMVFGILGQDALRALGRYTIDLQSMRLSVQPGARQP